MSDHDRTLTPWGLTAPDDLMVLLFEKLEEVKATQSQIQEDLRVHVASETGWQKNIEQKIDTHIEEHKAATNVWRKGAVGAAFMLIGSLVIWLASFVWAHRGP